MEKPVHDGSIGIRRFRPEDARDLFEAARESLEPLCRWMVWCRPDYSLEDSVRFISSRDAEWAAGREYSFAIYNLADGAFLGSAGLNRVEKVHLFANLGYWVRSTRTGRGIGSAAVRLVARFAFEELGLQRLEMIVPVGNVFSARVAEKAGAQKEGVLRRRLVLQGHAHDAVCYSLVAKANEHGEATRPASASIGGVRSESDSAQFSL